MEAEFQRRLFAPESSPPSFSWYTNPLLRRPHQERQEQRSSRNWLHLPVELILIIFEKLGAIEVLTSVQRVCMLWRTICKDPYTWRVINMRVVGFPKFMDYQLSSLCRRTIERSCGLLVDISIDYFATEDLLNDIANFWVKNAHRDRGGKVPHWCGCGLRPILRWSGTDSNSERPFYGCSNYNTTGKKWCGFFKWADVEEE
ncbi:F-box protein [Arachis hypogaea]|uniref:F-box protein n=1 Tax=Arachis hypogaea TaxID=3818 RepID=A0A6B9VD07_ARAHY|nr:F-box protein [Arachis hypogaea]